MASRHTRGPEQRSIPRNMLRMSERHTSAYLATREILRRIERASALACLTSNAVRIHWSGLGSQASDGMVDGARS